MPAFSARLFKESYYQSKWCCRYNGILEYKLQDKTRVDCLIENYACEFDFAHKWYEGFTQALWYSHNTGKKACLVLIIEKPSDFKYYNRAKILSKKFNVRLWYIKSPIYKNQYRCYNKDCIAHFNIPKDTLENKFVEYLSKIKPEKTLLKLFKAVMKDVYDKSTQEARKSYITLSKQLEIVGKNSKLLDLLIEDKISSDDYKIKSEQYENLEINLKSKIAINDVPQNDFENCLEYACNILDNLDTFWLNSKIDIKERLQKIIFPNGLRYETGVFRNTQISSLFIKKDASLASYIKWYPQANSNRCLHRERVLS